jgi:Dehydrogenases with different specificities (related to short-chain alcohol dehydrogenases)
MRFNNQVVFITGAASGIGRNAALAFAAEGARIALADWNSTGLEESKSLLPEGTDARTYQLDVSKYDRVKAVIEQVHADFGRLDIALNNAGVGGRGNFKTDGHTLEDWDRVIAINQSGVFYCMKEQLRIMNAQSSGAIVNVSSIAGLKGLPTQIAYVASKHAVIGMTKTAALEYGKKGIRVNSVCPVFTNSSMLESMFTIKEELRDRLVHTIPVGRYGETADVVNAMMWLSDPKSSFITGLSIPVDGGHTA